MMKHSFPFTLLRGGTLYAPQPIGVKDLLIAGDRIARMGESIDIPKCLEVSVVDVSKKIVVPGFIDLHVHLIGGGGEAASASRVPEIPFTMLSKAGITTVVGILGTDNLTRCPQALLAKVKALCAEGLSSYMYTGSYHLPSVTITGSVRGDIALVEEIVGVKVAISDHRSSQPAVAELARLASEARVGGMLGGKPGIVHVHVGEGSHGLDPILAVIEQTEIPIGQFLPTHVARSASLLKQGIEFVKQGGYIDITAPRDSLQWEEEILSIAQTLQESGIDLSRVTISSDGNGSLPQFDKKGALIGMATGDVASLGRTLKGLVKSGSLPLPQALQLITSNPANRLGLSAVKGHLWEGADADLVILDEDLRIDKVFAHGRLLVDVGEAVVRGTFE